MEEINLIPDQKLLTIGDKKYNVARISAERSLKAASHYNKVIKGVYDPKAENSSEEGYKPYDSTYDLIVALLDCVFILFRIDFELSSIIEWFRRITVTKKHILKTIDHKEIMDFIEDALEPIIGDKKKELKIENKIMATIAEMPKELLQQLLQSFVQTQDIKKNMSLKSSPLTR